MARQRRDLETLWRELEQAGSIDAFIDSQLREHGFLVQRQATDNMSKRELARYKKQLKEEAEERRRLRSEAWKAYQSKHIVHLGDNVFWNDGLDFDKWDLDEPEKRAAENELPAIDRPAQLAELLGLSIPELRWLSFHRDVATRVHYRRFTIAKRDGSERPIWEPLPKLKAAQHWILRNIVEHLLIHGAAHGFVPGRSIATNASIHTGSKLILKMDLRNFFPTVTLPRVRGVFRKAGYREQVATLLALLCTESEREIIERNGKKLFVSLGPRSLPQGAPTSPGLTNVVCLRMDRRLTGLAKEFGWRYSRYADDLTFSLPSSRRKAPKVGALLGCATRVVEAEGFKVNSRKTRVARVGGQQKVTGLVVNGKSNPRVSRERIRAIRAAIHNLSQGKELRDGETIDTLRGYAAFVMMSDEAKGRALLDQIEQLS